MARTRGGNNSTSRTETSSRSPRNESHEQLENDNVVEDVEKFEIVDEKMEWDGEVNTKDPEDENSGEESENPAEKAEESLDRKMIKRLTRKVSEIYLTSETYKNGWKSEMEDHKKALEELTKKLVNRKPKEDELIRGFNKMIQTLVSTIHVIGESIKAVAKEVEELKEAIDAQSDATKWHKKTVDEVLSKLEECNRLLSNSKSHTIIDEPIRKKPRVEKVTPAIPYCYICRGANRAENCTTYRDGECRKKAMMARGRCTRCTQAADHKTCAKSTRACQYHKAIGRTEYHLHAICEIKYPKTTTEVTYTKNDYNIN
uniref:Uncharacterized protein n=2 Tax=Caenorhabditis japonica TaxID=281687 RepID=A0A8R1E277_CAEJA